MGTSRKTPPSPELKVFASRLSNAIALKKTNIQATAKKLGCAPADLKKMTLGMREPAMKRLIALADTLGCPADYLLGLTPEAERASVAAAGSRPAERARMSGRASDKLGGLIAMLPELLDADIELLAYMAGFLIDRRKNNLENFIKAVAGAPDTPKQPFAGTSPVKVSASRPRDESAADEEPFDDLDGLDDLDNLDDDDFDDDGFEDDFEYRDDDFDEDEFDD